MTGRRRRVEWDGAREPKAAARVVNLREKPAAGDDMVRVDRTSRRWGNPYRIDTHGNRDQVIDLYRSQLRGFIRVGIFTLEDLAALDGKRLACWCAPMPCHGDALRDAAAWAARELARRKEYSS